MDDIGVLDLVDPLDCIDDETDDMADIEEAVFRGKKVENWGEVGLEFTAGGEALVLFGGFQFCMGMNSEQKI
jgi:hypothetical protein